MHLLRPSLFLLGLCFLLAPSLLAASGPNILLILADDLGYGDVRALNPRSLIPTPHLDRLASQGLSFTDAHSGSSVCTPTRYGLLTGRYAWRTRLQQGVLDGGNDEPLIAPGLLTLPAFLRQHGYTTACVGKWHLGFQSESSSPSPGKKAPMGSRGLPVGASILGGPTTRGFDLFFGCSNARTMSSLISGDRVIESIQTIDVLPRLRQRALDFLSEQAGSARPFFLYLPLTSPHTPIVPSPEWQGKSGLSPYADFVMQSDALVGDLLSALDQHRLADSTLVIFSSDNGCSPQADTRGLEKAGHFASGPYRGYKADIWEGGHRVPFLVRWPGRVRPGASSSRLLCLTDLFATCAGILQSPLPESAAVDSVSFLPDLLGSTHASPRQSVVHHSIKGRFAIRQGRWKLCLCSGSGGWSSGHTSDPQLYDLEADPAETTNLAASHPEVVSSLSQLLRRQIDDGRSTPGSPQPNDIPVRSPFPSSPPAAKD